MIIDLRVPKGRTPEDAVAALQRILVDVWGPAADGRLWVEPILIDVPPVRHLAPVGRRSPDTSIVAAATAAPKHNSTARRVLAHLVEHGPCTAAEIAENLYGPHANRNEIAARLWDLRKSGLVEYVIDAHGEVECRSVGVSTKGHLQQASELARKLLDVDNREEDVGSDSVE